ncbi:MAG TPA: carboxypeptidase-like regulatory domain-containing protein [Bryobacteraceae bacterium]|nr:carboxypeptidase-like regulatory domain-containing protein [Bryobacteraceae bacterium]
MRTKPPLKINRSHGFHGAVRVALLFLLAFAPLFASEHHGAVKFNGVAVPGATVTASQGDKKFVALTDEQGEYRFPELADGVWTIRVEMLCFEPLTQEVAVAADAPSPSWDLKLMSLDAIKAAASSTNSAISASVEKAAPATQTATVANSPTQTANPSLSAAVAAANAKEAANAPAKGKNAKGKKGQPAASTTANAQGFQRTDVQASGNGAAAGNDGAGSGGAAQQSTPEAGQASDAFVINGSANNGASSSFATNPAFGNNRRGFGPRYNGAINVTMDNSLLDANNYSLTGQDTAKPYYNHLKGNVSFGGPLVIPHLMPLRRTSPNFFIGYQWARNRNAYIDPGLMPTAAERNGDFSQAVSAAGQPLTIIDPTTGLPFPNNVIPQTRIAPQALALLKYYPQPNFIGTRYNYQVEPTGLNSVDGLQGRVNKIINNKNNTSVQFGWQRTSSTQPSVFGFRDTTSTSGFQATENWSHRFSQRMFLNLTYSFSRGSQLMTPYFANQVNVSGEAGITGNNQEPQNWGPPSLNFSGATSITGLSDGQQSYTRSQTSAIGGNLYWNHRSHNVTAGGDFRRQQFNFLSQSNARGSFGFTGVATAVTADGAPVQGTGVDFADFLLGVPDTSAIAFGNADKYLRESVYDAYFTDDWRMRAGFSLNWGMRWEYSAPITEKYGRLVNLDITQAWANSTPVVANSPVGPLTGVHYADSLLRPDKGGFEPRIGFAWHPILGSSTVVRGSYGIYRDTSIYTSIASRMAQQSPLSKSLSVSNSPLDPLTLADGFNTSPNTTNNTFAVDPNFRVGYAQIWQLSVQRDLPAGLVMTATYLGIKGTRNQQQFLPNTFPVGGSPLCAICLPGYTYLTSNGNSERQAGTFQLRRRLHNGFTASAQYTFAKAIDDGALGGQTSGAAAGAAGAQVSGSAVIAQNWLDLSSERALSNTDQRHNLTATLQYTSGMGVHGGTLLSGWRGALLKHWTFLTNITKATGMPLTPYWGTYPVPNTAISGNIRPDYTGQNLYAAPAGLFLNVKAVGAPQNGLWGNAGRNSITGPSLFSLDASMQRSFNDGKIDFRLDATNALNHVVFKAWGVNGTSPQFGLPTSVNGMRVVQVTIRWRFL